MRIGFVVNPVAGMGGAVGLKGTDGPQILREAIARGAQKVAPARATAALTEIKKRRLEIEFLTASGEMGEDELRASGLDLRVVASADSTTGPDDTVRAVRAFLAEGVDLILFAGGDGTARDILGAGDGTVPMLGIPAGVKMHSSVFAVSPEKVADAVARFSETGRVTDAEVMDVDEEAYRSGVLKARLFGVVKVPDDSNSIQETKDAYHTPDAEEEAEDIARYIAETMDEDTSYVLGPGTTTAAIARYLGIEKTVLGVDIIRAGKLAAKDLTERGLSELVTKGRTKIVVSPIGAQGFIFGRGNQQISPRIIRMVGVANVMVIATPTKLRGTPVLRVDTGDPALDRDFSGRMKVIVGYGRRRLVSVK